QGRAGGRLQPGELPAGHDRGPAGVEEGGAARLQRAAGRVGEQPRTAERGAAGAAVPDLPGAAGAAAPAARAAAAAPLTADPGCCSSGSAPGGRELCLTAAVGGNAGGGQRLLLLGEVVPLAAPCLTHVTPGHAPGAESDRLRS